MLQGVASHQVPRSGILIIKKLFDESCVKASPQSDIRLEQQICSLLVLPSTNMIYFQLTTCRLFVSCTADSSESDLRDFSLWQLSWWAASPAASNSRCGPHLAQILSWHAVKLTKFTEFRWPVLHDLSKDLTRLVESSATPGWLQYTGGMPYLPLTSSPA